MNTCSIPGCDKPKRRYGWCETHYKRWRRNGDPLIVQPRWHKHSLHGHPLYATWSAMMARCYNVKNAGYHRYGGRGIRVCERWHDVAAFVADVSPRPDGTTLDRRDNDGDYCADNCRWADLRTQAQNRQYNRTVTVAGVTLCVSEWARRSGLKPVTVFGRLRSGWGVPSAVSAPPMAPSWDAANAKKRARATA